MRNIENQVLQLQRPKLNHFAFESTRIELNKSGLCDVSLEFVQFWREAMIERNDDNSEPRDLLDQKYNIRDRK